MDPRRRLSYAMENGPPDTAPSLLLIIAAAGVLVLGAAAVTLGLARYGDVPLVGGVSRHRAGQLF